MKILDILKPDMIIPDLQSDTKNGVLEELAAKVAPEAGMSREDIQKVLMEREKLGSTGMERGVAIPHAKLKGISKVIACFAKSLNGVDFSALDGQKSYLFFLLLAPENFAGEHLKALARISRLTKNPQFRESLLKAQTKEELFKIIEEEDLRT